MKKKQLLWLLLFAVSTLSLVAQQRINTHTDFSAQTLVADIFASGVCENIDVINPIGHENGLGYFENGQGSIGIETGIILSTGNTQNAHGPNNATDKSSNLPGPNFDADLGQLATGEVHDAVGIEFDFVPLDSLVQFRYVFASEEYCEFVGSNYNDVFGFFISGPGIDGPFTDDAVNVALVPGSSDYVSINAINFNRNEEYYIHNETVNDQQQCNLPIVYHPYQETIQYDGFTQVMTARILLEPCQTYHIRLVVGDVADPHFDSAVFLEAGSFSLGPEISVEAVSENNTPGQLYEGCEEAAFRFTRSEGTPLDLPFTVRFYPSEASTAIEGLDYEALPREITIPAGEAYADLAVRSLSDALLEDPELLRLVLDIPCACYADSADLRIVALPPLELNVPDIYLCPGEEGILDVQVTGGSPPFSFSWSTGSTNAQTTVQPEQDETYTLVVLDRCEQVAEANAQVELKSPPTARLSGNQQVCAGTPGQFPIELQGIPPFELELLHNDEPIVINLGGLTDELALMEDGYYELVGVTDAACAGEAEGDAQLDLWDILAVANIEHPECFGEETGAISVTLSQGTPPYLLNWLNLESSENTVQDLSVGWFDLQVTDNNGCEAQFSWEINTPAAIDLPTPTCEQLQTNNLQLSASGGVPPYQYQLTANGPWIAGEHWWRGLVPGEETEVIVRDGNGCEQSFNWLMPPTYPNGLAWLPDQIKMVLGTTETLEWECYVPTNLLAELRWEPEELLSCVDCRFPELTATYPDSIVLYIEDVFGCNQLLNSQLVIENKVDIFLPNAFSPNGDDQNDEWLVFGNEAQIERIARLLIFDRWGNMVFQAADWPINSERHGWDGYFRGQQLDPGVYVYSIELLLVNGETQTLGGDILLLR
ncbi:MAG: choice-of-anchor L domain-containing protein [Bacteroidota bacterium]